MDGFLLSPVGKTEAPVSRQTRFFLVIATTAVFAVDAAVLMAAGPVHNTMTAWDGTTFTSWNSPRFGFRISVPDTGYMISVESAAASASPSVPVETVILLHQGTEHLRIETWRNQNALTVADWVDRDMGFLDQAESRWTTMVSGTGRYGAIRLDQPKSPQILARTVIFVATDNLLLRITCNDSADIFARALFEAVVASLTVGGQP